MVIITGMMYVYSYPYVHTHALFFSVIFDRILEGQSLKNVADIVANTPRPITLTFRDPLKFFTLLNSAVSDNELRTEVGTFCTFVYQISYNYIHVITYTSVVTLII